MDNSKDTCILIKPDVSMLDQIVGYRAAFLASGESMDGTGPLRPGPPGCCPGTVGEGTGPVPWADGTGPLRPGNPGCWP